jgi:hypothetical protein
MSNKNNQEDEDWLDALAGKPRPGMDALAAAEALAVGNALSERRESIEAEEITLAEINRFRQRLEREGFRAAETDNSTQSGLLERFLGIFGASDKGGAITIPLWGVAAVLFIVVAAVIQTGLTTYNVQDKTSSGLLGQDRPRGTTKLIVDDPRVKLAELQAGLQDVKANFEIKQLYGKTWPIESNRFQIDIKLNDKVNEPVFAYLEEQGIPTVENGIVRILIQRPAAKP